MKQLGAALAVCAVAGALWLAYRSYSRPPSEAVAAASAVSETGERHAEGLAAQDDDDAGLNGILAVVNGEPITQNMVDQAVRTQIQVWLMGNKGMVTRDQAAREIRKMEERALDDLIDRNLILSEFKKRGGQIKDQFVDEAVNTFIKDRFGGDRSKFLAELRKTGMTIAQFRELQRDRIAIQALRQQNADDAAILEARVPEADGRVAQKEPYDSEIEEEVARRLAVEKRQDALDTWLAELRSDAKVRLYGN